MFIRPIHFCYYLQGFVETTPIERPSVEQWEKILKVFNQVQGSGEGTDDPYSHSMMPSAFVSWLRGYVEISAVGAPNEREWAVITEHLQLVFTKVTHPASPAKDNSYIYDTSSENKPYCGDNSSGQVPISIPSMWRPLTPEEMEAIHKVFKDMKKIPPEPGYLCGVAFTERSPLICGHVTKPPEEDLPGS